MIAGLAPLVVITVVGLALLLVTPGAAVWAVLAFVTLNAAGSFGDLMAVAWVLTRPPATLVRDTGAAVEIYQPI